MVVVEVEKVKDEEALVEEEEEGVVVVVLVVDEDLGSNLIIALNFHMRIVSSIRMLQQLQILTLLQWYPVSYRQIWIT